LGYLSDLSSNIFAFIVEKFGLPPLQVFDQLIDGWSWNGFVLDPAVAREGLAMEFVVVDKGRRDAVGKGSAGGEESPGIQVLAIATALAFNWAGPDVVIAAH
jgi:hypothetical protein